MIDLDFFAEIWETIRRNRSRSLLTAFGVFWGLLMLIILVGVGTGLNNGLVKGLQGVPASSLYFGTDHTSMPYKGFQKGRRFNIDNDDVSALRREFSDVAEYISPINFVGSNKFSVGDRSGDYELVGITPDYFHTMPLALDMGRTLNVNDILERRKVCVIGRRMYNELFPGEPDIAGQLIKAGSVYYQVVGVIHRLSDNINIGFNADETLMMPITTAQLNYGQGNTVHFMSLSLRDGYSMAEHQDRIIGLLKQRHIVHPDDPTAFWSFNVEEIIGQFSMLFSGVSILIWIVGIGSLLAGLIGISNIMLVTVRERTQEIGIRRALGARPSTITRQILSETLLLTFAAGIGGLLIGVWIITAAGSVMANQPPSAEPSLMGPPQIPFSVAVAAFIILILGGLLAGWLPARRAMRIKAIDALREE